MTFDELLAQILELLQRQGRVSYGALKRRFSLDEAYLDDLKTEIIEAQRLAVDEQGRILVWTGGVGATPTPVPAPPPPHLPDMPSHIAEKILTSRAALEGERKQVTVLFADLKGSMELLAERDPEEARQLLDPVLERMLAAVHRYEGTVNQVLGDGMMALFGAPLAHEDHAARACYAALAMQEALRHYSAEVHRTHGVDRLPPEDKRLLQTAAVIGTEVPLSLLPAIADVPAEALHRSLSHVQAAEFLYETRLFPEHAYTFKHALAHKVAYSTLLQERRRVLHGCIVEALETLSAERLAEQVDRLAHHAVRGVVWDKALLPAGRGQGHGALGVSRSRDALRAGPGGPGTAPRGPRHAGTGH